MQKTGESYTTARAHLLTKKQAASAPRTRANVDYAKLAGISDAAIKAKTGCTWERWVSALDYAGAHAWPHHDIAEYVHTKSKVQLGFTGKGTGKSQVAVQHGKLVDAVAATKMKAFWEERFRALAEVLGR